jgi:hypothetical protein
MLLCNILAFELASLSTSSLVSYQHKKVCLTHPQPMLMAEVMNKSLSYNGISKDQNVQIFLFFFFCSGRDFDSSEELGHKTAERELTPHVFVPHQESEINILCLCHDVTELNSF